MTSQVRSESRWVRAVPVLWCGLLAVLLLGPALAPGLVLSYDMVWVPDLALRPDFLGVASGLPRAVPSDAVIAVLDEIVPGQLLQKTVLLASLVGGGPRYRAAAPGVVADRSAGSDHGLPVEPVRRGAPGHRALAGAGRVRRPALAARPRPALAGLDARFPLALAVLVPIGSLSASAGVATGVALLAAVAGRDRRRLLQAGALVLAANAPWLVSGFLHTAASRSDPAGADVFALAGEGSVPAPLAALTLGGIWNSEVVPPSRTDVLGWVALGLLVVLVAVGLRRWWETFGRREVITLSTCWAIGMVAALRHLGQPGPGRLGRRQRARWWPLPRRLAAVVAVRAGRRDRCPRCGVARIAELLEAGAGRWLVAGALVALPVLLMPDALLGVDGQPPRRRLPGRLRRGQGRHRGRTLRRRTAAAALELSTTGLEPRHQGARPGRSLPAPRLRRQRRARRVGHHPGR